MSNLEKKIKKLNDKFRNMPESGGCVDIVFFVGCHKPWTFRYECFADGEDAYKDFLVEDSPLSEKILYSKILFWEGQSFHTFKELKAFVNGFRKGRNRGLFVEITKKTRIERNRERQKKRTRKHLT